MGAGESKLSFRCVKKGRKGKLLLSLLHGWEKGVFVYVLESKTWCVGKANAEGENVEASSGKNFSLGKMAHDQIPDSERTLEAFISGLQWKGVRGAGDPLLTKGKAAHRLSMWGRW